MLEDAFAAFAEHGERDAEAAIGGFGAGDGLEEEIDRRAAIERGELRRDVREAAGLRGHVVGVDEALERVEDRRDGFDGIGGGIHADDGVAAAVEQAFEGGEEDAADVVDGMIRLDADAENAALAHRVAAAGDIADFRRGEDEILVAHDFGDGGGDFGNDGALELVESCASVVASSRMYSRNSPTVMLLERLRRLRGRMCRGCRRVTSSVVGIDQRLLRRFPRAGNRRVGVWRRRVRARSERRCRRADRRTSLRWLWRRAREDRRIRIARALI